ncbi:MAG: alcohol dehydrogenase catalytic domain-containing protein [Verrucomicrobiae bacterium]|nr:alcohol dehydrogenase catalytic domain-containing protein [Verrucomicrobiae bacterium]
MFAALLHGRRHLTVESLEEAVLGPGEVRVRVAVALTCGTDLKVWDRGYHARMLRPPCRFGHEFAGVICEVTPGAVGWAPGDRVVAANSAPCGCCPACRRGQENLCDDLVFLNGAYAESLVIPARIVERNLLRLGAGTAFRDAALTEPLACVLQGLDDLRLQPGERLLVVGAGPIGLLAAAVATDLGADVAIAGRGVRRLAAARRLGVGAVVNVTGQDDVEWAVKSTLEEARFDAVFEAVGTPATWAACTRLARKGGRVNWFGGCPADTSVTVDTELVHYSALTLMASFHHTPRTIRRALQILEEGRLRTADLVDAEASLRDLPRVFESMASPGGAIKTAIQVNGVPEAS